MVGVSLLNVPSFNRGDVECQFCDRLFSTGAQLAGHMAASHGHSSPVWDYVAGSRCRACLKQFWTMSRLRGHLAGGGPCLAALVSMVCPEKGTDELSEPGSLDDFLEGAPAIRLSGTLRWIDPEALTHIKARIAEATPFERVLLCRSARAFGKGRCEAFESFLDVMEPKQLSRGPKLPPEPSMEISGSILQIPCFSSLRFGGS